MPTPIPAGTRIRYTASALGVSPYVEATKYVGTILTGATGTVTALALPTHLAREGWVVTEPDAARYYDRDQDPDDVEPTPGAWRARRRLPSLALRAGRSMTAPTVHAVGPPAAPPTARRAPL